MQPMGKSRTARRLKAGKKTKRDRCGAWRMPKHKVEMTWPIDYGWWSTATFRLGPDTFVRMMEKAVEERMSIQKVMRCAEAAGLLRRIAKLETR